MSVEQRALKKLDRIRAYAETLHERGYYGLRPEELIIGRDLLEILDDDD